MEIGIFIYFALDTKVYRYATNKTIRFRTKQNEKELYMRRKESEGGSKWGIIRKTLLFRLICT
jgi:hypothetical protein